MTTIHAGTPNPWLYALTSSNQRLQTLVQSLSSGSSVNADTDPAALDESTDTSVQLSGQGQALSNLQDANDLLATASGALGQISSGLQQLNTLAVEAGDGALSASDLQTLQSQADQITQSLGQVAGSTQFNGQNLLDGSFSSSLQIGAEAGQTQTLSLADASPDALGVGSLDLSTPNGQADALTAINNALQQVNDQQSTVAGLQSGLSANIDSLSSSDVSLASSNSQVSDTDYAQASAQMSQIQVQQEAALKVMSLYQSVQQMPLNTL